VSEKSIEKSKQIIQALEAKADEFNSAHFKKVSVAQLKKVFHRALKECYEIEYCFARINLFLRISSGDFTYKHYQADNLQRINIAASIELEESDFDKAKKDIEKFEIDFKISSIDNLYLDYTPLSFVSSVL